MRVTMADLARQAGVSKSTISRALSDDPRVKAETRRKIHALAQKLRYQPHPIASGLARNRTHALGLAIPSPPRSFSNPFYLEFIGGVGDYALTQGYTLFFARTGHFLDDRGTQSSAITPLADGFILTEPQVNDPRVDQLKAHGKPFVFLGSLSSHRHPCQEEEVVWVEGDNIAGVHMAVEHLLELGHRHIGCITGSPEQVSTHNRFRGFQKALETAGLPLQDRAVVQGDFTEEGGRSAAETLLAQFPQLTAVFASNDLMAIGAIHALRESGREVPRDVSVVGFDGIHFGRLITPELTTAAQPIYRLGQVAAELLLQQVAGKPLKSRHVTLPCTLRVGASSSPPAA